jgi:hypothetical protein
MPGALTISQMLMPVTLTVINYHSLYLWHVRNVSFEQEKEKGKKESRKSEESLLNRVGITMDLGAKIKMPSISSVEIGVLGEKILQTLLILDYLSLSLFLYLSALRVYFYF